MYNETYFPGRVKTTITRVLGGDRFCVVFEACVGITKWLLYILLMPKNDSIIQRDLYILLRSVHMIAQLSVGAIFFFQ